MARKALVPWISTAPSSDLSPVHRMADIYIGLQAYRQPGLADSLTNHCMRIATIFRGWVRPGVDPGFLVRRDDEGAEGPE